MKKKNKMTRQKCIEIDTGGAAITADGIVRSEEGSENIKQCILSLC